MRRRVTALFLVAIATFFTLITLVPVAHASQASIEHDMQAAAEEALERILAQADEGDETSGEGSDADTEGAGGTEAETGADEGETAEGTTEEGPPWTYQMARLGILLLVGIGAMIGFMYYKMIVVRQRGEA